ncbi:MAG: TRAP transporter TatT component family protein [Gammaproteobacteria bacterium]|nr:TRAP transporter TatT component family protein [Gammaproteobacteria bacterium]MDH5309392.1 TRAP transporter TatT component family protein [Gammaproteobacteria bacterium]
MSARHRRPWLLRVIFLAALSATGAGCQTLVSSAAGNFADNLSAAVVNQNDPETVRDGAPAYLLLLDSFIEGNPEDPMLLAAAANLYASYGAVFAGEPARAARLTERAQQYASKAICNSYRASCGWQEMTFEAYEGSVARLSSKHADIVYAYSVASLAYIRTHSDDWNALARLPHMEALLKRYLDIAPDGENDGSVYTFLGILATLRPPALGGEPEKGREYFEEAIRLGGGQDLSAKVEFARGYARPLYERELHDRLLSEVLEADPEVPGYTLTNVLAQRDAKELLASADDYF